MAASHATHVAEPASDACTPTTDLRRAAVAAIARALRPWLADGFAWYVKPKNVHWHMRGRHVRDDHLVLDEHSTHIFAMTDASAERARQRGTTTLHSISASARHQRVQDTNAADITPQAMLAELGADNPHLTRFLHATHAVCEASHDVATARVIEHWMDETERRTWFVAATTGDR